MKVILTIAVSFVLLAIIISVAAVRLPANTIHRRTVTLGQPAERVFAALEDVASMPKWNRNTERIELLSPIDGKEATRQTFKGGMVATVVTTESAAPTHLTREMTDPKGGFFGSWGYELSNLPAGGSQITLTERSRISNLVVRLMMRLSGPTKYIDEHLEDLAKNFGEVALITSASDQPSVRTDG